MTDSKYLPDALKEKIEVLDGSRAGGKQKAAVRIEDLNQLLQIADMKSSVLTAAPTMDDFNALRSDIKSLHDIFAAVSRALQARVL